MSAASFGCGCFLELLALLGLGGFELDIRLEWSRFASHAVEVVFPALLQEGVRFFGIGGLLRLVGLLLGSLCSFRLSLCGGFSLNLRLFGCQLFGLGANVAHTCGGSWIGHEPFARRGADVMLAGVDKRTVARNGSNRHEGTVWTLNMVNRLACGGNTWSLGALTVA